MKRNIGKHTPKAEVKANILAHLAKHARTYRTCSPASAIGRAAYPGYNFKRSQGAALSVRLVLYEMERDGLISHWMDDFRKGYYITTVGLAEATT